MASATRCIADLVYNKVGFLTENNFQKKNLSIMPEDHAILDYLQRFELILEHRRLHIHRGPASFKA